MKYTLRSEQVKAVEDILRFVRTTKNGAGMVVAPTSFGKSLVVAKTAQELGCPVVVLQPTKELLKQNYEKYLTYSNDASIFSASLGVKEIGNVTFATIGSIINHAHLFKKLGVKVSIMDECHIGSGKTNQVYEFCVNAGIGIVVGLTATPVILKSSFMGEGSELVMMNRTRRSFFSKIIHVTQIKQMVDKGYWTKVNFVEYKGIDMSYLKPNTTGSDFTDYSLKQFNKANGITKKVAESVFSLKNKGRKKILVFCSLVEQAYEISALIRGSKVVHGGLNTKERDITLKEFITPDSETFCVVNVNVLGVGFDFPGLDGGVHCRPTNSLAIWYQHVGRFVRIMEGKDDVDFIDLSGNYKKFGHPKDFVVMNDPTHGWAMFANGRKITGVSMLNSKPQYMTVPKEIKVEKVVYTKYDEYIWPFGMHKDKKITEVPPDYLRWVTSDKFIPTYDVAIKAKQISRDYLNSLL